MKNVLVVVNLNAGRKKAIYYKKSLQKFLLKNSNSFKFITLDEFETVDFTQFDTIIAMGGDGTVNKVLPYVRKYDLTMGIIPSGTANLLAEKLGIPADTKKAIKVLKNNNTAFIDTININGKDCILRFGFGFDSNIICKTPQSLKNKFGYFAYFIAGILFALRLKTKSLEIVLNNESKIINASCIIVANASNMYRNIFCVGKASKLNDGMFEVFILKTKNPIMFFIEFLKIGLNVHRNSNFASYLKTDNLIIKTGFLNAHIDGEKTSFRDEISFKIQPSSIRVLN